MIAAPRYDDLVGIPHEAMNCYEIARVAAERFGRRMPEIEEADLEAVRGRGESAVTDEMQEVGPGELRAGDLIMMLHAPESSGVEHLGIYLGGGLVLHSIDEQHSKVHRLRALRSRVHSYWRLPPCS